MSEIPCPVGRESKNDSSKTLYEPSWPTETPYETSKGDATGGTSAKAPPQHTDPNERSVKRKDQEATSNGSHNHGRRNVHRGLKYSSTTSQTEDSQKIIASLRREVSDLKREARGRTPVKERPRNRVNASKRGNPECSNYEYSSETFGSQSESRSLTPQTAHRKPRSRGEPSRSQPPLSGGKNPQAKKHSSRKIARPEE